MILKHIQKMIAAFALSIVLACCGENILDASRAAIKSNNVSKLERILKKHRNSIKGYGDKLLSYAMRAESVESLRLLITLGADPNFTENDKSLLQWAVINDQLEFADLLFEYGADINFDSQANNLMQTAIKKDYAHFVRKLLEKNIDLSFRGERQETYFDIAIKSKAYDCALELISSDEFKQTVISESFLWGVLVYNWNNEKTPLIINKLYDGKNPDWKGSYPLICAIDDLNLDAVIWLLNHGVQKDIPGYYSKENKDVLPIYAANCKEYELTHYAGKDYKLEAGEEISAINSIIELLRK